MDMHM